MAYKRLSIEWDKHYNLIISDIDEKLRSRVVDYMMEHFHNTKFYEFLHITTNEMAEMDLRRLVIHILENNSSVVVMEDDRIRAVALAAWMCKKWHSWTYLKLYPNENHIIELFNMIKNSFHKLELRHPEINLDNIFQLFFYKIDDDLINDQCFIVRFFNAIYETGRHMGMTHFLYIALSNYEREIVSNLDLIEMLRIIYSMYIEKGRRPFDKLRDKDEMYATIYMKTLLPLIPFSDMIIRHDHLSIKNISKKKAVEQNVSKSIVDNIEVHQENQDDD